MPVGGRPTQKENINGIIDRWLLDAEYIKTLIETQNINPVKERLFEVATRIGSAAGLLHLVKHDIK